MERMPALIRKSRSVDASLGISNESGTKTGRLFPSCTFVQANRLNGKPSVFCEKTGWPDLFHSYPF